MGDCKRASDSAPMDTWIFGRKGAFDSVLVLTAGATSLAMTLVFVDDEGTGVGAGVGFGGGKDVDEVTDADLKSTKESSVSRATAAALSCPSSARRPC